MEERDESRMKATPRRKEMGRVELRGWMGSRSESRKAAPHDGTMLEEGASFRLRNRLMGWFELN